MHVLVEANAQAAPSKKYHYYWRLYLLLRDWKDKAALDIVSSTMTMCEDEKLQYVFYFILLNK